MKLMVTGGAGFIGSHVVDELLELGHLVVIVDNLSSGNNLNQKAEFINIDISNLKHLHGCEAVIHLAAQTLVSRSVENPFLDAQTNIFGTLHLLELCRKDSVRMIFASSAAVYGSNPKFPIEELAGLNPESPYALAKITIEKYLKLYHDLYDLKYTILRFANVFGPRQQAGIIPYFCQGGTIISGDGLQSRDFVYVKDVADAIIKGMDCKNDAYNVGTGVETSMMELFQIIKGISNSNTELHHSPPQQGDIKRSVFSIAKIGKAYNWSPQRTLLEGLKQTWQAYQ